MAVSKLSILTRALALSGTLASGVLAKSPLTDGSHTETAEPQEIGSMTSDGLLIYSLNYCTIVQTTNCAVSTSTGPPTQETSAIKPNPSGGEDHTSGIPYPAPTGGESGNPGNPTGEPGNPGNPTGESGTSSPGGGEPTYPPSGSDSGPFPTGGSEAPTGATSASVSGSLPPSESGEAPTNTHNKGESGGSGKGTATESAPNSSATTGGAVVPIFDVSVLGVAGMAAVLLV